MTRHSAPPLPSDFDDLWRPAQWSDRCGGNPLGRLFVGVSLTAFAWNLVAKMWLRGATSVPANSAFAACLVAAARIDGLSWEELGMRRDRLTRGLAVGMSAATAILSVLAIALAWPATRRFVEDAQVAADTAGSRAFNTLVRIPLGTVVLEETLFRSVLLALALRPWSVPTAVSVTSAVFGLWHVVPTTGSADDDLRVTLETLAVTTLGGVLFAWLRLRANSVAAPMLAHVATNSLGYLAVVVAPRLR